MHGAKGGGQGKHIDSHRNKLNAQISKNLFSVPHVTHMLYAYNGMIAAGLVYVCVCVYNMNNTATGHHTGSKTIWPSID